MENKQNILKYELTDHLGNVRVVISDEKLLTQTTGIGDATLIDAGDYFSPKVVSFADYYAFGSTMPGRSFSSDSYRYGFNGMEKDDEIKGNGNSYDMGARLYDPRLVRVPTIDPLSKKFPNQSPYVFAGNNPWWSPYQFAGLMPIRFVDLDGLEPGEPFDSPLEAGKNFLEIYNEFSIQENREFSTTIYKYQDKDGKDQYSYNVPKRGTKAGSSSEFKADKEGAVPVLGSHTHGAFDKEFKNNEFSGGPDSKRPGDIEVSEDNKAPELLGTPQGSALIYDPKTKQSSAIKASIPSDPNDPDQVDSSTSVIPEATSKKQTRQDRRFFKQVNQDIRKIYKEEYKQKVKSE